MSKTLTVTEMSRKFADYINRVSYRRESFTLIRGNRPVAEVRPVPSGIKMSELPAFFASLPRLSAEDAEQFAEDIEYARRSAMIEDYDPWER
jgi:antitoxin (DNA-binding transcriptional repressor) of toxin-antitoxin stability system